MDLYIKLHYLARKHDDHQTTVFSRQAHMLCLMFHVMPRHWISTEDVTDNETLWNYLLTKYHR